MDIIARTFYFILIGWWLGFIWYIAAFLMCVTIIGLPIGLLMLNRLPQILTLKPIERMRLVWAPVSGSGPKPQYAAVNIPKEELPFILRTFYFIFAGWWIAGLMGKIAFLICLTIVLLPLGLYIFNRFPLLLTLKRVY